MALTARTVTTAKDGSYSDGNGLYLRVRNGGSTRFWVFRWKQAGKARGNRPNHAVIALIAVI